MWLKHSELEMTIVKGFAIVALLDWWHLAGGSAKRPRNWQPTASSRRRSW
jgi:hypothetical protein